MKDSYTDYELTDCCSGLGHVHPKTWFTHGENTGLDTNEWGVRVAGLELGGKICYDYPNGTTELPNWNVVKVMLGHSNYKGQQLMHCRRTKFSFQKTIGVFYAGGADVNRNKIVYQSLDGVCFEGELVANKLGITYLTEKT